MMRRLAPYFADAAALALVGLWLHLVPMVANVTSYNGYSAGILNAHRFLLAARETFDRVILLTSEPVSSQALNRRAELAFPPTGGVPAYIFPFLTALNGADFVVEAKARFCAAEPEPRALILLPPLVAGDGPPIELSGDRVLLRLKKYGFVFHRALYLPFLATNVVPIAVEDFETADFGQQHFESEDPSALVVHRLEADGPVYRYVSRSKTLRLRPPAAHFIGDVAFSQDPIRDRPFDRIELDYVKPARREILRPAPSGGVSVTFDMVNLTSMQVEMSEAAFSPDFKAYVFTVRNPQLRAARPLPVSVSSEPFSICR